MPAHPSSQFSESVRVLRGLLTEAHDLLADLALPQQRERRCREVIDTALAVANDLAKQKDAVALICGPNAGNPAAVSGSKP